jgi:hypothetical protein
MNEDLIDLDKNNLVLLNLKENKSLLTFKKQGILNSNS